MLCFDFFHTQSVSFFCFLCISHFCWWYVQYFFFVFVEWMKHIKSREKKTANSEQQQMKQFKQIENVENPIPALIIKQVPIFSVNLHLFHSKSNRRTWNWNSLVYFLFYTTIFFCYSLTTISNLVKLIFFRFLLCTFSFGDFDRIFKLFSYSF